MPGLLVLSVYPTPSASTTATPVYVSAASTDLVYAFAVIAFLLSALVVLAIAQLVRAGN